MGLAKLSRRHFFFTLPATCFAADQGKGRTLVSRPSGYADPSTEFPVIRLTDPAITSLLPASYGRSIGKRGNFLLFSCDASGRMEVYRLEYRTGEVRQLTEAEQLEPRSVTLVADERNFAYLDGDRLVTGAASTLRARDVYRAPAGFSLLPGFSISEDGLFATLIEKKDSRYRLRLIRMMDGNATTLAEADEEMSDPIPRPKRASALYRRAGGVWLANFNGQQNYRMKTADGDVAAALWSPGGRTVVYLSLPTDKKRLNNLREFTPDTNDDRAIADTSQFVSFAQNADGTVFIGASGSKASPHVLLLVRAVRRELTLAEHRASDPKMVSPVFSPNSQRIFFNSDRHGKPAIYSMQIERLVEQTEDDAAK